MLQQYSYVYIDTYCSILVYVIVMVLVHIIVIVIIVIVNHYYDCYCNYSQLLYYIYTSECTHVDDITSTPEFRSCLAGLGSQLDFATPFHHGLGTFVASARGRSAKFRQRFWSKHAAMMGSWIMLRHDPRKGFYDLSLSLSMLCIRNMYVYIYIYNLHVISCNHIDWYHIVSLFAFRLYI